MEFHSFGPAKDLLYCIFNYACKQLEVYLKISRSRERERDRERERERERERDRQTDIQTDRETDRQTDRQRQTDRDWDRDREDRDTERHRETETERETETDRESFQLINHNKDSAPFFERFQSAYLEGRGAEAACLRVQNNISSSVYSKENNIISLIGFICCFWHHQS